MPRPPFPNEHIYAVDQEILRHDDACHYFGEMTACIMLWSVRDFQRGLVARCPTCYTTLAAVADAYGQGSKKRCLDCYGTTFEGGIRAIIYRPAIWAEDQVSEGPDKRGVSTIFSGTVQVTSGFMMRDNDYVVRYDGTRWRITAPQVSEITTGFSSTAIQQPSGSFFRVQLEDATSIVYSIPTVQPQLEIDGWSPYMLYPTVADVINGPLIPDDIQDQFSDFGPPLTDDEHYPVYDGGS